MFLGSGFLRRGALVAVLIAGGLCVGLAPGAWASGGYSPDVRVCQNGGWQDVARWDGAPFTSQVACTSYGGHGGAILVSITLSPSSVTTTTASADTIATVTANYANGPSTNVTSFTWSDNSNPAVATLGIFAGHGIIHPVSVGTTHIQATYGLLTSNTMAFTVDS